MHDNVFKRNLVKKPKRGPPDHQIEIVIFSPFDSFGHPNVIPNVSPNVTPSAWVLWASWIHRCD